VTVTLSIPRSLADLDFGIWPPSRLVTRANDYLATWFAGTLAADSGRQRPVCERTHQRGGRGHGDGDESPSSSPEADPTDNMAQVSDFNAEILMPIIDVPEHRDSRAAAGLLWTGSARRDGEAVPLGHADGCAVKSLARPS